MDEFKPEDELKPDPSDRRSGRNRKADERDSEPHFNVDDVELDADEPRPARSRRTRDEEEYENDDEMQVDAEERRPARARKKSAKPKVPVSRQHLMMGIGILVLLLLIIGIGSALKAPSSDTETVNKNPSAEKNIDLSGSTSDQANGTQPQPGSTSAANQTENAGNPQEVTLPAISSTPTDAQTQPAPQGQQRVEVPGDLNNALTQQSGQIDNVVSNSTLPTAPATVAAVAGSNGATTAPRPVAKSEPAKPAAPRQERKTAVIEPHKTQPAKQQTVAKTPVAEPKPVTTAKRSEPAPVPAPTATTSVKVPVTEVAPKATTTTTATAATPAPKATAAAPVTAATGAVAGDAGAIKGAPGSNYTLQLSSSSNSDNLNAWAKKEKLQHYMVYQTVRNGQPWYVLVSGIYASKDEAKRAVATLPADVQAKNPWAKPIHQVQSDLK
ncbi:MULTISPECIES: cell division protein DamX [Buttiauxella]|uniref:Cell division protein DamX n=1 Tax=Buttiauxella ferragutiae ATCC 51602 TaxID=1354252 RepID=A0ABX2WBV9_9ENTR|nr:MULTISPECIES: cell division protein DamX [Buttiauxella]AYN28541.1 cell division protein DamX [Buttiauxella sp. 3AFRM03]OAT29844.1 inner membrane bile resistance protein [Buttiauxella ferragutiae ATCC 51602]TDN52667.1 DamX protein [Buttiauxella sp. JUb87]UNK61673.1 cell division protein DamX [Buttiauxella ferragutiae]